MNPAYFLFFATAWLFLIACAVVSVKEKNFRTLALFMAAFLSWMMIFWLSQDYILYPEREGLAVYGANEYQQEIISWMPDEFLTNLSRIIMIDSDFFEPPVVGTYYWGRKTIYIDKTENLYFMRDIYHETGHHIESQLMTSKERKEWIDIFNRTGGATWYGRQNEEEAFAEAITCYYNKDGRCIEFIEQTEFIDKLIARLKGLST